MGSYQGNACHCLLLWSHSEAALACAPRFADLWGKNVLASVSTNWVTLSECQTGTPCPMPVGRLAHVLWDTLPNCSGTQCPLDLAALAFLMRIGLLYGTFPLRFPDCNGFGDCSCLSNAGTLDETWKVDMSASNSTPLLKKENHCSPSMPNILMKCPQRKTCPGKRLPVAAPSLSSSAALDSVTLRRSYCSAPADFFSSSLSSVLNLSSSYFLFSKTSSGNSQTRFLSSSVLFFFRRPS